MIIYILLFLIVGITYYFIKEQNKFNNNPELVQIQDPNKSIITEKVNERNPLLIHNLNSEELSNISIKKLVQTNPGYIIYDNGQIYSGKRATMYSRPLMKRKDYYDNISTIKFLEKKFGKRRLRDGNIGF